MLNKKLRNAVIASALVAAGSLVALPSQAATYTLDLVRKSTLTNVDDSEGRWQFDGGNVYMNDSLVGYYTRKKRVSFGIPSSINKSSMEMTIIWRYGDYNFTVQGTHYFGSGKEVGGVSATSTGFTAFEDSTFTGDSNTITITY